MRVSRMDALGLTDAIIFDVDGVLIDSRDSYDRAIEVTVSHFLSSIFGLKLNPTFPTQKLVETLRTTGQYNNDIDATAAILVSIVATLPSEEVKKCLHDRSERTVGLQETLDSEAFPTQVLSLLNAASHGFASFADEVKKEAPNSATSTRELLERLGYPGGPESSSLSRVFDEYYYGPELLKRLHGLDSVVGCKRGLIDFEKILVQAETLQLLSSLVPKGAIGIVSGRSRLGTEQTLGELMRFFQDGPTIFLEDHDPHINTKQPIPGKPSPESLLLAADHTRASRSIVYVGDSVEDLMMTNNANRALSKFTFCGVTSTADSPHRASALAERGADAILRSVNDLPFLLSSVR